MEQSEELLFDKIRMAYPDLPEKPAVTLSVSKIELLPGGTQIKISAKTGNGVRTTIVLEKTVDHG